MKEGRDAAFWEDANGKVIGLAAWQYYWAALDFYILPGPEWRGAQVIYCALFRILHSTKHKSVKFRRDQRFWIGPVEPLLASQQVSS